MCAASYECYYTTCTLSYTDCKKACSRVVGKSITHWFPSCWRWDHLTSRSWQIVVVDDPPSAVVRKGICDYEVGITSGRASLSQTIPHSKVSNVTRYPFHNRISCFAFPVAKYYTPYGFSRRLIPSALGTLVLTGSTAELLLNYYVIIVD